MTTTESNWRWCKKCQGLTFAGNPAKKCPEGGNHNFSGSSDYKLMCYQD